MQNIVESFVDTVHVQAHTRTHTHTNTLRINTTSKHMHTTTTPHFSGFVQVIITAPLTIPSLPALTKSVVGCTAQCSYQSVNDGGKMRRNSPRPTRRKTNLLEST